MKSRILVVIAVLAALLATTPSVGAQEAPNQDPATPAADEATEFEAQLLDDTGFSVAEWIPAWEVTRLSLGFATPSRQWLTRLVGRDQGQTTYEAYGVPLSNDEEREMKIRARLDEELPQVRKEAAEIIGFAGTFMELAPTGKTRIVIRTTETVRGRDQRAIRDLTTLGSRVKFDGNAEHSLDTLEAAFEDIAEVAMGDDSPIHGVRVDIPNNQVVVAVEPNGPADVDLPISVAGIVFIETTPLDEVSGCSTRFLCGEPVRGGLEADNLAPGRSRCTSGFMVRTNEGQRAMLWAAHCGEDGDEVKIGNRLGPTGERFTQFSQSGTVDAALVSININQSSNYLYRTNGDKSQIVSSVTNPGNTANLSVVCLHGIKVGRSCGPVLNGDTGMYSFTSEGRRQTFDHAFDYELTVPGRWGCQNTEPNNTPGGARVVNPRWFGGNSGGPIATSSGLSGVGLASSCRRFTRVFTMSDGTTTTVQSPVQSPSRFIETTTITLRGAHLQVALDRVGTSGAVLSPGLR